MATGGKPCQAEDDEHCTNAACGFCYHCSRDLCIDHFTEHAQRIDALTRSSLKDYLTILTNISSDLKSLKISSHILEEPFAKIEQWRQNAYQQIDEIGENKCREVQEKIEEYRQIFNRIRKEQLERITRYKQKIAKLFRTAQVTDKEMSNLEKSIERIQNDLALFDKHSIEVLSNRPVTNSIHIRMKLNDWKPSSPTSSSSSSLSSIIRQFEFRLKYVRLSGIVTCHDVFVDVNGTINDLIDQFVATQDPMIKQKRDYILPTEVCQNRARQRFSNQIPLRTIFNKVDELVLYETPFALNTTNLQQYCLILCRFQEGLPWDIKSGVPFLLHVPRSQCRGRDIINILDKTLNTCFSLPMINTENQYEVRIVSDDRQLNEPTILNQWADKVIDEHLLLANNATLIVNLINTAQASNKEQTTRLARLDDVFKVHEKRRKSRK